MSYDKDIKKMLEIPESIYHANQILRGIRQSYYKHNSLTDEQIILFKTILRELGYKSKGKTTNIGFTPIANNKATLTGIEINLSVSQLHEFMKKDNTIKRTQEGKKVKFVPCILNIKDGILYINYDAEKRERYKHTYKKWDKLTDKEKRVIKQEKRKAKSTN